MYYHWRAEYRDGSHLDQFPDNLPESNYTSVNNGELTAFILLDQDNNVKLPLKIDPSDRVFYRKRVMGRMTGEDYKSGKATLVTDNIVNIVGIIDNKLNIKKIVYLYQDGRIEIADRWGSDSLHLPIMYINEELNFSSSSMVHPNNF